MKKFVNLLGTAITATLLMVGNAETQSRGGDGIVQWSAGHVERDDNANFNCKEILNYGKQFSCNRVRKGLFKIEWSEVAPSPIVLVGNSIPADNGGIHLHVVEADNQQVTVELLNVHQGNVAQDAPFWFIAVTQQ